MEDSPVQTMRATLRGVSRAMPRGAAPQRSAAVFSTKGREGRAPSRFKRRVGLPSLQLKKSSHPGNVLDARKIVQTPCATRRRPYKEQQSGVPVSPCATLQHHASDRHPHERRDASQKSRR